MTNLSLFLGSNQNCLAFIYLFFNVHFRPKLDSVVALNEQLKKKEESYKTYVYDAIFKHVDALVAEMNFYASKEMINNFQFYIKKISLVSIKIKSLI